MKRCSGNKSVKFSIQSTIMIRRSSSCSSGKFLCTQSSKKGKPVVVIKSRRFCSRRRFTMPPLGLRRIQLPSAEARYRIDEWHRFYLNVVICMTSQRYFQFCFCHRFALVNNVSERDPYSSKLSKIASLCEKQFSSPTIITQPGD